MPTITTYRSLIATALTDCKLGEVKELLDDVDAMYGIKVAESLAYDFGLNY